MLYLHDSAATTSRWPCSSYIDNIRLDLYQSLTAVSCFWSRCLCGAISHHGSPVWHSSALHGVCYWAVHSLRASACSHQNMSLVERWVTLQTKGSSVARMTIKQIMLVFLVSFCYSRMFTKSGTWPAACNVNNPSEMHTFKLHLESGNFSH